MKQVTLRAHHLIRGFERYLKLDNNRAGDLESHFKNLRNSGYGEHLIESEKNVFNALISDPNMTISINDTYDDLCAICQKRMNCDDYSEHPSSIKTLNDFGYKPGDKVTSGEFIQKMRRRHEMIECVVEEILNGTELGKYLHSIAHTLF
jgi:hypothetical protein